MSKHLPEEIEIKCPNCGFDIQISLKSVGKSVTCSKCGQTFETKDNGITEAFNKADKAVDDFLNDLKF